MITETVKCDICGIVIPKANRHQWHNLNIVRHVRSIKNFDNDLTASFHICMNDFKYILFEVLGRDLDKVEKQVLMTKIIKKLRLGKLD